MMRHPVASLFCLLKISCLKSCLYFLFSPPHLIESHRTACTLIQSVPLHGLCPSMHCTRPCGSVAPPLRHVTGRCSQEQTVQLKTHK